MKEIISTNGFIAIVDDEDHDLINYNWFCNKNMYFFCSNGEYREESLHQVIANRMNFKGPTIDHKDRNTLNNIRSNLRLATYSEQEQNKNKKSNTSSDFKGVSFNRQQRLFHAYIKKDGVKMHLGRFKTQEEAARAYDKAAKIYFGEFAVLNFPKE